MTRHATAFEVKATLARFARVPPDDVDGYVIVLAKGDEVTCTVSNAADEATLIALLARAIEHRSRAVGAIEDKVR